MTTKKTPRQELRDYCEGGYLRMCLSRNAGAMTSEAIDLCIRVISDYCASRKGRKPTLYSQIMKQAMKDCKQ